VAINTILKQIASDKSSLLPKIQKLNTQSITTELNCKLFTNVIKEPSKEAWVG
jgi:hypothetical protein